MIFPFGIEKEAEIYCNSAKFALARQAKEIECQITEMAENLKCHSITDLSYTEILDLVVFWTEDAVRKNGWDIRDEDGVAWMIGLFTKSYIKASGTMRSFDEIFQQIFIKYFRSK